MVDDVVATAVDNSTDDNHHDNNNDDMGYEDCAPQPRRGSMTHQQEKERRASIKAVMADPTMSQASKRRSIQHLMDGRRNSMNNNNANGSNHGGNASVCSSNSDGGSGDVLGENGQRRGGRRPDEAHCAWNNDNNNISSDDDVDNNMDYGDGSPDLAGATGGYDSANNNNGLINNEQTRRAEQTRPHCPHYDRHCTMVAPCCGAAFGCRICHDECPAL